MAGLFVVTGIQAAGKSTIGRALAERFDRGVYVDGDTIRASVVSGRVDMSPDPSPEAVTQLLLRYEGALAVAMTYLGAGFDAVVTDVILGEMLPRFLALVPVSPIHLIVLNPRLDAIRKREAYRSKTAYGPVWTFDGLYRVLVDETPRLGLWLDTSDQSPAETVDEILARRFESIVAPDHAVPDVP